jgi:hypothetical protein
MSQSLVTGSELNTVSTLPAIPGFQVIVGDEGALGRESIEFTAVITVPVTNNTGTFDFDLFDHLETLSPLATRVSAVLQYPLSVTLNYQFGANPTIIAASGALAVRYPAVVLAHPVTVADTLACFGSVSFNLTQAGAVINGSLRPPPLLANDILIRQIMGHRPVICVRLNAVGISNVLLSVNGSVALRGVGLYNPF